jgi:hypothetical protein
MGAVRAGKVSERPKSRRRTCLAVARVQSSGSCRTLSPGALPPMATPNRQICAQLMAHLTALLAIHTRQARFGIHVGRIVAYVWSRPCVQRYTRPTTRPPHLGSRPRPGPGLSFGLIHPRPPPFTDVHSDRVRAVGGRRRTPVNAMQQCWKACWCRPSSAKQFRRSTRRFRSPALAPYTRPTEAVYGRFNRSEGRGGFPSGAVSVLRIARLSVGPARTAAPQPRWRSPATGPAGQRLDARVI